MEKRIKKFWVAGFFLPAINATVFSKLNKSFTVLYFQFKNIEKLTKKHVLLATHNHFMQYINEKKKSYLVKKK